MPFFCIRKMYKEEIEKIITPVIMRNNCFLWGTEILRGKKNTTLRIFIDSEKGVDINDCENISKDLNYEPTLDLNFGEDYVLEVSTPGLDRKFFDINQLKDYIGEELTFKTRELYEGKRNFTGILKKCTKDNFEVKIHKKHSIFNFTDLDMCRLKPNYKKILEDKNYAK